MSRHIEGREWAGRAHPPRRTPAGAGSVIAERYQLEELISMGGMSEVWLARDTTTGTAVAVKMLRHDLAGDARFLRRLRMEARNTEQLRHRNVVALLDHGERDGTGFLVQEYVPGESLASVLNRVGRLPTEAVVAILAEALSGLAAAHHAGVIHRDVKPGNVLITPEGTVKLSDFGISFGADQPRLTSTGMVMGTAEYLSPEQATGKPATAASDIYAAGIIAHEALSGQRPFTGRTQVDVALAQVEKEPPPLPADVPVAVRTVVLRMLAKDPASRPRDARQAAELLSHAYEASQHRQAQRSSSGVTTRSTPPPPPPPSRDRFDPHAPPSAGQLSTEAKD